MPSDDPRDGDPFDELRFDEEWVARASRREPPAHERVERAAAATSEATSRAARHAVAHRADRKRRRKRRVFVIGALLLFVAAVAIADRDGGGAGTSTWGAADADRSFVGIQARPTPAQATSQDPLGSPQDPGASAGDYAFLSMQPGGRAPVAYDPCRKVELVINGDGAPPGGSEIVRRAVSEAAEVSGLDLEIAGSTNEQASPGRPAVQRARYGDRWAPVLVAWSDEDRFPALAGDVAGVGGSAGISTSDGPVVYVTGMVVLDAPDAREILDGASGERVIEDLVLHELAHVLGLAHVDSEAELMYPEGQADLHGYQPGDRTGLTKLGRGACVSEL